VISPFDAIAPAYNELWSSTTTGLAQRAAVWREIDPLFTSGDSVLDLGCGPGDDAVHLSAAGVHVLGIDVSAAMVEIAKSRGVIATRLAIENLDRVHGRFDGVISNFGALNCVSDLRAVARELGRLLRPASPLAVCLISRFCLQETFSLLSRFQVRKAFRRWPGKTRWRGIDIYYRTSRDIRKAFEPWFQFCRRVSIGGGDHELFLFERRPL
jgi:SAM-dependent methyltransferase